MSEVLLRGEALVKTFRVGGLWTGRRTLRAVDGVTLEVRAGRTLGLVGESGSGKSTVARMLLGLLRPTSGRVQVEGADLATRTPEGLRALRRHMQLVFQDPASALNPKLTARQAVREPFEIHDAHQTDAAHDRRVDELLARVGLPRELADRRPAGLSGGQKQRVVIARALACAPRVLVADEPVAALDVSIQAQVLNLLAGLQQERGLGMLFISHDLGVVSHVADEVAVLYLGRLVEQAPKAALFAQPLHPYTRALLSAAPGARVQGPRVLLQGEPPSPLDPPPGCAFHPRCPLLPTLPPEQQARCRAQAPALTAREGDRAVACHAVP